MNTSIQNINPSVIQPVFQKIHEIRELRVMMDYDLAELYQVETKYLKRAVNQNIERFPSDFMFQLARNEYDTILRCKKCTSSLHGGIRYLPYAFTEQGVAMLSGVIRSPIAIAANIAIMRAFVALRQYTLNYAELSAKLEDFMHSTNTNFSEVFSILEELTTQKKLYENRTPIGFK